MLTCAERFAKKLDSKDLHYRTATNSNGDDVIIFPYQRRDTTCFFSGEDGKYLSMYTCFESVPEDKYVEALVACNELNAHYKWVTFYIDKDKDIIVHDDAILNVETAAEEAFELLLRMLDITSDAKPVLMKVIYA